MNEKKRLNELVGERWQREIYPGGPKRFEARLFAQDIAIMLVLPSLIFIILKSLDSDSGENNKKPRQKSKESDQIKASRQVISFEKQQNQVKNEPTVSTRAPGTLIRVRLLNLVETFEGSPVHALILDSALGKQFVGGTLIGTTQVASDSGRVLITFSIAKPAGSISTAYQMSARALAFDGTLGVSGEKKEGFFARATLRSTVETKAELAGEKTDLKTMIAKTVANGLIKEFQDDLKPKSAAAQVLSLPAGTELYAELSDVFPSNL